MEDPYQVLFDGRALVIDTIIRTDDVGRAVELVQQACRGPLLRMSFSVGPIDPNPEEIALLSASCPHDAEHPTIKIISCINTDESEEDLGDRIGAILKLHVCSSLIKICLAENEEGQKIWQAFYEKLQRSRQGRNA